MGENVRVGRLPNSNTPNGSFWADLKPKLSPLSLLVGVTVVLKLVQVYFPASVVAQALHHYLYFF
jgi:hypothetical protein